jgi:hypothetical protein
LTHVSETGTWNVTTDRSDLPYSKRVHIPTLLQVFSNTASSYKYLYFLSLLEILAQTGFNQLVIDIDDIILEMLVNAWYPHTYFKLSFGLNDRIADELNRLGTGNFSVVKGAMGNAKNNLKAQFARLDVKNNSLSTYVPFRLLSPFFSDRLRGTKDADRNKTIMDLAWEQFDRIRPFYYVSKDKRSIVMHPEWMLYFNENFKLVQSFIAWNWLEYMQKRNPAVPNIQIKLLPPSTRNPLTTQSGFWRTVLRQEQLTCIYSGEPLTVNNFSLDHFLPWSFVAHDQLWNLIPVSININSSKSNKLPSLERYFNRYADIQSKALIVYHNSPGKTPWKTIVEPYVADLKIKPAELFDRDKLFIGLKTMIEPLYSLATNQGFTAGWEWKTRS